MVLRRSSSAPVSRSGANTVVHSSKGRLLVTIVEPGTRGLRHPILSMQMQMRRFTRLTNAFAFRCFAVHTAWFLRNIVCDMPIEFATFF